jgi:hypothetical protein
VGGAGGGAVNQGLRTGQLAERAGVNVQTLRYYERRGLRARASAKLAEVERRLADLEVVRSALLTVLASDCDSLTGCRCELAPLLLER